MVAESTIEEQGKPKRRGRWRKKALEAGYDVELSTTESKGRATPTTKVKRSDEGNALTRPFSRLFGAIGDVQSEVRKVTWPTREETMWLTRIVIITTIISAIFLGLFTLFWSTVVRIGLDTPIIFFAIIIGAVVVAVVWIYRSGRPSSVS